QLLQHLPGHRGHVGVEAVAVCAATEQWRVCVVACTHRVSSPPCIDGGARRGVHARPRALQRGASIGTPPVRSSALAIVPFPLRLVDRRMLAPSVGHYVLERDDGQPLDFVPGQFIQIHFDYADGTPARRSYSLATLHDRALGPGEAVEIAVGHVPGGAATALFEGMGIGDRVEASGPYGRFCLMPGDRNRRYLLIG